MKLVKIRQLNTEQIKWTNQFRRNKVMRKGSIFVFEPRSCAVGYPLYLENNDFNFDWKQSAGYFLLSLKGHERYSSKFQNLEYRWVTSIEEILEVRYRVRRKLKKMGIPGYRVPTKFLTFGTAGYPVLTKFQFLLTPDY